MNLIFSKCFQTNNPFETRALNRERTFFYNCLHFRSELRTILELKLETFFFQEGFKHLQNPYSTPPPPLVVFMSLHMVLCHAY